MTQKVILTSDSGWRTSAIRHYQVGLFHFSKILQNKIISFFLHFPSWVSWWLKALTFYLHFGCGYFAVLCCLIFLISWNKFPPISLSAKCAGYWVFIRNVLSLTISQKFIEIFFVLQIYVWKIIFYSFTFLEREQCVANLVKFFP